MLGRRVAAEASDPFATDPDPAVRHLGRLALRRDIESPSDYFALGDLCARLAGADGRLLVSYIGKTLEAYERAGLIGQRSAGGDPGADARDAAAASAAFVSWVLAVADAFPTPQNIAAALWAAARLPAALLTGADRRAAAALAGRYMAALGVEAADAPGAGPAPIPAHWIEEDTLAPSEPLSPGAAGDTQTDLLDTSGSSGLSGETADDAAEGGRGGEGDAHPARATAPGEAPAPLHREDESSSDETGDFRIGDRIGERYEVREIRRGGMGVIYLCYDHLEHESVAIKTFQGRFLDHERATARFIQEARTWIQLEKHNNIVQARKVETFGDVRVRRRPHIILEYIAGPERLGSDLKSWIEHNRLDLATTVEIGLHICLGMMHAVSKVPGLVHRDLKPANILVRHDGLAKVTDFGLVRSLEYDSDLSSGEGWSAGTGSARLTHTGHIVGTLPYMSPEQCAGGTVDLRSDIYAFGAILFEMLTGQRVFRARTSGQWMDAHWYAAPMFPYEQVGRIPADLRALTLRCLAKQPDNRPGSWDALRDELAALYEALTGAPPVLEVSGTELAVRELMDKAYSLTELGFGEEALGTYDRALALDPGSAWVWARKGRTLRVLLRYDEALACYERALALDPGYAWAWTGKGVVLERLNDHAGALDAYATAFRLRPGDVWPAYNRAGLLLAAGQPEAALADLDAALDANPKHVLSHVRRGHALREMGQPEAALQAFEEAIALDARCGPAWLGKGEALRDLELHGEAATAFLHTTRLMPDDVAPWLRHADTMLSLGRYADSLPSVQQATRLRPGYRGAWLRLGLTLRGLDRHAEAIQAYDRALEIDPTYGAALAGKAEALRRMGQPEAAIDCYRSVLMAPDQAPASGPEHASLWSRLGGLYRAQGMRTEALDCFERAAAAAPGVIWHVCNQADMLIDLRRYADAVAALDRALAQAPGHVPAWVKRGVALRRARRFAEAVESFREALALDPGHAYAWNGCGLALERLGQPEEALTCYERAVAAAPDVVWYRLNMVDPLLRLGRREDALDACDEAEAMSVAWQQGDPRSVAVYIRKGQVLRSMNRHEDAIEAYERALAHDPDSARAWSGKGQSCAALGRREEALTCFSRAAALAPANAWFWYNQGGALIELGHYTEAIQTLNRALEIEPRHRRARLKRDEARRKLSSSE